MAFEQRKSLINIIITSAVEQLSLKKYTSFCTVALLLPDIVMIKCTLAKLSLEFF